MHWSTHLVDIYLRLQNARGVRGLEVSPVRLACCYCQNHASRKTELRFSFPTREFKKPKQKAHSWLKYIPHTSHTTISKKVALVIYDARSMFHCPQCVVGANLVLNMPAPCSENLRWRVIWFGLFGGHSDEKTRFYLAHNKNLPYSKNPRKRTWVLRTC